MSAQFENKVVLITGGSTGIGNATATAYAKAGAKVVIADVNVNAGEAAVQGFQEQGHDAAFIQTNVTESKDVEQMVQFTLEKYGRLDIACNNAGIEGELIPMLEYSEEMFDQVMAVNVRGVWLCMKYQVPAMLQQGGGAIVNIASVAGVLGVPKMGVYVGSKHAVIGLTKSAALEYVRANIRINAVCPSIIATEMAERGFAGTPDLYEKLKAVNPTKRLGQPQEVAAAILWLSSDAASYVNGHSLMVDGGLTIQ